MLREEGEFVRYLIVLTTVLAALFLAVVARNAAAAGSLPSSHSPGTTALPATHPYSVARLSLARHWQSSISPNADSAPAYLSYRGRQYLYVLAGNNGSNCNPGNPVRRATLYAFNAGNGKRLWTRSTSGPSRCTTAGPVVDHVLHRVYAPGLDGRLHAY